MDIMSPVHEEMSCVAMDGIERNLIGAHNCNASVERYPLNMHWLGTTWVKVTASLRSLHNLTLNVDTRIV